jgi:cob(I)alamin adenosyltransferase
LLHRLVVWHTRAVTVNLTRIYTRLGDDGETHLGDMSRVSKNHARVEAYGTVDELNSFLGLALACASMSPSISGWLSRVQNDLLDVGADLSVPGADQGDRLRIGAQYTGWLEGVCDEVNAGLAPLRSFVIPGGNPAAAHLHVCRTICRRAERRALAVDDVNPEVVRYLNRLSDLLFILARAANLQAGDGTAAANAAPAEPLWEPGRQSAQDA